MSLTVNSRPATWAGTSGPIIYKMTTTDHANAGYYLLVEIWNSTTGLKIGTQKCYPNSAGLLSVRVEAILKSNMSLDNGLDLTLYENQTTGVVLDTNNWIEYYIKYNQYWSGSSPALISDIANLRYAIYGGLQLGVINDMTLYYDGSIKFLTDTNELTALNGEDVYLTTPYRNKLLLVSFIAKKNEGFIIIRRYKNGVHIGDLYDFISFIGVNRILFREVGDADNAKLSLSMGDVQILLNSGFTGSAASWNLGSWNYVSNDVRRTMGGGLFTTGNLLQTIAIAANNYTGYIVGSISGFSGSLSDPVMNIYVKESGVDRLVYSKSMSFSTSSFAILEVFNIVIPVSASDIFVVFTRTLDAVSNLVILTQFELRESTFSEEKSINILESCGNEVVLQWKNSLGGDECYPFTYNQEYTFDYGGGKKAKRLTLFAHGLSLSQWEAINGLNTLGEPYKTPITEMTTSINRTMATIGQSVYILNSDGTKIGVTVINVQNTTQTKKVQHEATVTIEYPEIFLQ